jgi:hypothetical protein
MNTIDTVIADRMQFTSIDGNLQHSRLMDAYVDNTAIGMMFDDNQADMDTIITRLEYAAQTWELLLFYLQRLSEPIEMLLGA